MEKHHALARSGHRKVYWVPKHREGIAHARGWGLVLYGPGIEGELRGRGIFILDSTGVSL